MSDACLTKRRSNLNKAWLTGEIEESLLALY